MYLLKGLPEILDFIYFIIYYLKYVMIQIVVFIILPVGTKILKSVGTYINSTDRFGAGPFPL